MVNVHISLIFNNIFEHIRIYDYFFPYIASLLYLNRQYLYDKIRLYYTLVTIQKRAFQFRILI